MRHALLLGLPLACAGLFGCYNYVPVQVILTDSTSHQPAAGVGVRASYRYFLDPFHPDVQSHLTDASGRAVVPVAIDRKSGLPISIFVGLWIAWPDLDYRLDTEHIDVPASAFADLKAHRIPIAISVNVHK
jgi:hypothetical protein